MIYTDDVYIQNTIFKRKEDAHKGNFGRVMIFAGSPGMAGAAVLCGRAALKSGAGLLQYLLPDFDSPLLPVLQISVSEATCLNAQTFPKLSSFQAIAAGSGLGDSIQARSILTRIIDNYEGTLVLDADALNMIAASSELAEKVRKSKARIIMTPHIGEARRLLHSCEGIKGSEQRRSAACAIAEQYQCIAVLKGPGTLVAQQREQWIVCQNTTGNPGMATAGSGDVLSGLIASLAAQGYSPLDAARTGVFIHGKAGDLAAERLGEMGMTSSDIVSQIPYALDFYYKNASEALNLHEL